MEWNISRSRREAQRRRVIAWAVGGATGAAAIGAGIYFWLRRRREIGKPALGAADMLRSDHEKVKELFNRFEKTMDQALKDSLAGDIVTELEIHAALEEEIFYPAVR